MADRVHGRPLTWQTANMPVRHHGSPSPWEALVKHGVANRISVARAMDLYIPGAGRGCARRSAVGTGLGRSMHAEDRMRAVSKQACVYAARGQLAV